MSYRLYRALIVDRPSNTGPGTKRVSKLADHIPSVLDPDATFQDVSASVKNSSYALAKCDPATHALIAADPDIVALSPEGADKAAIDAWLDAQANPIPAVFTNTVEGDGFSLSWVSDGVTRRQVFNYILRCWRAVQNSVGAENESASYVGCKQLFAKSLTQTWNSLTNAQKNAVKAWLEAKGMDTSAVANNTPVRTVIHSILSQVLWVPLPLGEVAF